MGMETPRHQQSLPAHRYNSTYACGKDWNSIPTAHGPNKHYHVNLALNQTLEQASEKHQLLVSLFLARSEASYQMYVVPYLNLFSSNYAEKGN